MILYTIMPLDIIFNRESSDKEQQPPKFETEYLGVKVQVELLADNRYVISRIISTSPQAFLNPKLQPGTVVNWMDESMMKPM